MNSTRTRQSVLVSAVLLFSFSAFLHAASPDLSSILPRGGQRGTEQEVSIRGARLNDAQEILFYEPGISVISLEVKDATRLDVKFKIEPTARLGQYVVRVRTLGGISNATTVSVGQYPIVNEKEPNDDFAQPQKVALNSTVHGVANTEDIDYYLVEAKKGQRITAEIEAMRLGSYLTDCYVAILDMKRFELASSDDSSLALQDPIASVIAPEDGTYVIAVRESSYAGNGNSRYCLHVGEAPRPTIVYPAGGKAGDEVEFRFLGDVKGDVVQKIKLPDNLSGDFHYYLQQDGQSVPSPNTLRVVPFGNVMEVEPNNGAAEATKTDAELPLAFNGIIATMGDTDYFRFNAKKGQTFDVRCVARGIRSPLDSVLTIHNAQGGQIAANDDSGGPDSYLRWAVPADGEYLIGVRDHLGKGGADYVYRVEFMPITVDLSLSIPEFARNRQDRNTVSVPRGNRYATLLRIKRNNFGGNVVLSAPDLPAGVTVAMDAIDGTVNDVPVVFEATADAVIGAKLIPFNGQHFENKAITGGFTQSLDLIYGQPNNTVYYRADVDRMAVAVTEEVPFKITVIEPKVPLVRNGSMNLRIVAERKEGFKAPIRVRMLWNPPGIGSANEVVIGEGQTECYYSLNANGNAPARQWKIAMLALSDEGKGAVWTSSQLASLTVAEPYLGMSIPMAAGEQGKSVAILCKLDQLIPFDGEAVVELHGIPPKVTITQNPMKITKDMTEVIFTATLAPDAPVGQHKSLFTQVVITKESEPIAHNIGGGGVLRIDSPPPPKPNAPPPPKPVQVAEAPKPAPPKAEPPPKPLSRLEKLRLEAEERAKAEQK
ncbi:MAG: PPC domain-containing protein [Phycisphaeraceae bacterium]